MADPGVTYPYHPFYYYSDPSINLSVLPEHINVKHFRKLKKSGTVDEIFKLAASSSSSSSSRRCEALEPSKEIIKTDLFMHQKLGLSWLIHREDPDELHPFWVKDEQGSYRDLLTDTHSNKRPNPLRGGIFADDMGFGKTLTLLSLIATDSKPFSSVSSVQNTITNRGISIDLNIEEEEGGEEEEYLSVCVGGKRYYKDRKQNSGANVGSRKKRKIVLTLSLEEDKVHLSRNMEGPRRTTLIICPPSVLSTWTSQVEEHTRPGMLKVFMYYGIPRINEIKVEELQKYDIVLTTYDTVVTESRSSDIVPSCIVNMEWFRVILDEAHVLKKLTCKSQPLLHLKAKSRWAVSGMPILNGSFDLHFFMAFLRFKPFSDKKSWRTLVKLPIEKGKENGFSRLQDLMATISLRRLKGDSLVGLPPKTVETCFVELSAEERVKYDKEEVDSQDVVRNYIRLGRVVAPYSRILAIIQRLRQMCNDVASCPSGVLHSYNIEDVSMNPELLLKMVSKLQDGDCIDCPICYSPLLSDAIITRCGHIFCKNCILKSLIGKNSSCPMCRHHLSKSDLFSAPSEEPCSEDENQIGIPSSRGNGTAYSSKVFALLKLLVASRNESPSTKSVVFSQFRKMLILLEEPLKAAGFTTLRLDGRVTAKGRADYVIRKFRQPSSNAIVLLVDLKASERGIDLTGASMVYLLEPWLNPAVEERAIDRVHRIGRKEEMNIVRLIARNSIEERILELHQMKKNNPEFGKKINQRHNEDFRVIMGL